MNRKGNPATLQSGRGRPKGSQNKVTREIKAFARSLLEDPGYQAALKTRLKAGKAPHLEPLLYHYAYGKPKEQIEAKATITVRLVEYARGNDPS